MRDLTGLLVLDGNQTDGLNGNKSPEIGHFAPLFCKCQRVGPRRPSAALPPRARNLAADRDRYREVKSLIELGVQLNCLDDE